jgi:RND family efflux transporter MFP subunit
MRDNLTAHVIWLAALVSAAGCGRDAPHAGTAPESSPPLPVTAARVSARDVPELLEAGGVVRARTSAALTSRIVALIREVRVEPGDTVRAGQVLVVLDGRDLASNARRAKEAVAAAEQASHAATAERDAAQAALAFAQATHQRIATLHGRRSATAYELDQAVSALRSAEARLAGAEARIQEAGAAAASLRAGSESAETTASYAVITAPFDGLVTEKLVDPGNMATPGAPLVRVDRRGGFRLEVRVDESRAAYVRSGDRLDVAFDFGSESMAGTVSEIARAIDADLHAFVIKIDLPDSDRLRPGMFGRARVPGPSHRALLVPGTAVVRRGQVASVFVVEQGHARLRLVSTGASTGDEVEVLAGLSEGEIVVTPPPPRLVDGARVTANIAGPGVTSTGPHAPSARAARSEPSPEPSAGGLR